MSLTNPLEQVSIEEVPDEYSRWVKTHPQGTFWQSKEWYDFLKTRGENPRAFLYFQNGQPIGSCLASSAALPIIGGTKLHIPRGPLTANREVSEKIIKSLLTPSVVFAHLEHIDEGLINTAGTKRRFKKLSRGIYPSHTLHIDLTKEKDVILAEMPPKGRYNIKKGIKQQVTVTEDTTPDRFIALQKKLCTQKNLPYHGDSYYKEMTNRLSVRIFTAELNKKPAASALVLEWNNQAIYYYGAGDRMFKKYMAPYALHWHIISFYKDRGFSHYDFHGVDSPDSKLNSHLQGVGAFKRRFGGAPKSYAPPYHIINRPVRYILYKGLQKIAAIKRAALT